MPLSPDLIEITRRIRALREDLGITQQEMADATERSLAEYVAQESGEQDLSFTFLHKCAERLGVDITALLTGETPHLGNYCITRAGKGVSIRRRAGLEYLYKVATFKDKLCEPFVVTAPYLEEQQDQPIHLSHHEGQELDFIISGSLRFAYDGHEELLEEGDIVIYDSSHGHGMIAAGGRECVFLAVILSGEEG